MRIEVLIDVKTVLGEGPLWDVDEQRLYFIDSFGCNVFRCTADGGEVRAWDVPAKIGSMALRRQGGAVLSLANGFHFLDFKTGECQLIVDPEPTSPPTESTTARWTSAAASSRDRWIRWRTGPMARSIASILICRFTSSTTKSSSPTGRAGVPDGRIFYFADTWSGEIWAYDYDLDTGAVSNKRTFVQSRSLERRRRRWLDRRRRGLPMECAGLRRKDRPLYAGRQDRSRHRHAGQEGDQRDVRRAEPRCPLCDVDGQATATSFSRRWRSTREPVRDLRSCNSRRA